MLRRFPPLSATLALVSMLLILPALGCHKKPFAVEVAPGFTGYVHIFCGPTIGLPSEPVRVNSVGGADPSPCPGEDVDVTVLRDGQTVPASAVTWERSGDGSPVALSFTVK